MVFPSGPADGSTHTVGTTTFIYRAALDVWDRVVPAASGSLSPAGKLEIPQTSTNAPSIPVRNRTDNGIFADGVNSSLGFQFNNIQTLRVINDRKVIVGEGDIAQTRANLRGTMLAVVGDTDGALLLANRGSGDHVEMFTDNRNQFTHFSYKAPDPDNHAFIFSTGLIGVDPTTDPHILTIQKDQVTIGTKKDPFTQGLHVTTENLGATTVLSVDNRSVDPTSTSEIALQLNSAKVAALAVTEGIDPAFPTQRKGQLHITLEGIRHSCTFEGARLGVNTKAPKATLHVNGPSIIIERSDPPASSSASGEDGEIRWDDGYLYLHANGAWKRAALTTW